jgi:putative protease
MSEVMKKIELLAPAGDFQALKAAVEYGADAVYIGSDKFSARSGAQNFDDSKFEEAIDYAHLRDCKVYVALNTLISDNEMSEALAIAENAVRVGADALILQDLGLIHRLGSDFPIRLHASTQATIFDSQSAAEFDRLGFARAVCARELSMDKISEIRRELDAKGNDIELEVFAHGALCISYSGQCLFSSMLGGRSGNRGSCAQPCRKLYGFGQGNSGYYLSPKDLCTLEILPEIINSGVQSLKIEGRMKSPEYVGIVVDAYRKRIDEISDGKNSSVEDIQISAKKLAQNFNRGGFTKGYIGNDKGKEIMSFENPKNIGLPLGKVISYSRKNSKLRMRIEELIANGDGIEIYDGKNLAASFLVSWIDINHKQVKKADAFQTVEIGDLRSDSKHIFEGMTVYKTSDKSMNDQVMLDIDRGISLKKIALSANVTITPGEKMSITIAPDFSFTDGPIVEEASSRPISSERVNEQLIKTGNTPFVFGELNINIEGDAYISASAINDFRRTVLELYSKNKIASYKKDFSIPSQETEEIVSENAQPSTKQVSAYIHNVDLVGGVDNLFNLEANIIYLPASKWKGDSVVGELRKLKAVGKKIYFAVPVSYGFEGTQLLKDFLADPIRVEVADGVLVSALGQLKIVSDFRKEFPDKLKIALDYTFNIFNSEALSFLKNYDVDLLMLSPELTLEQIQEICSAAKTIPTSPDIEVFAYGRLPLMNTQYCPTGAILSPDDSNGTCTDSSCKSFCRTKKYSFIDRMQEEFPVVSDILTGTAVILNSKTMFIPDEISLLENAGVTIFRMNIYDEDITKISLTKTFEIAHHITKGHLFRGVYN